MISPTISDSFNNIQLPILKQKAIDYLTNLVNICELNILSFNSCQIDENYLSLTVKGLFLLAYQGHNLNHSVILDSTIPNLYYRLLHSISILPKSHLILKKSIECKKHHQSIKIGFASSFFFRHRLLLYYYYIFF